MGRITLNIVYFLYRGIDHILTMYLPCNCVFIIIIIIIIIIIMTIRASE
jgi:hypothetical protein